MDMRVNAKDGEYRRPLSVIVLTLLPLGIRVAMDPIPVARNDFLSAAQIVCGGFISLNVELFLVR
jgi:hypothetical protein